MHSHSQITVNAAAMARPFIAWVLSRFQFRTNPGSTKIVRKELNTISPM
jgi:hypothetical protein